MRHLKQIENFILLRIVIFEKTKFLIKISITRSGDEINKKNFGYRLKLRLSLFKKKKVAKRTLANFLCFSAYLKYTIKKEIFKIFF